MNDMFNEPTMSPEVEAFLRSKLNKTTTNIEPERFEEPAAVDQPVYEQDATAGEAAAPSQAPAASTPAQAFLAGKIAGKESQQTTTPAAPTGKDMYGKVGSAFLKKGKTTGVNGCVTYVRNFLRSLGADDSVIPGLKNDPRWNGFKSIPGARRVDKSNLNSIPTGAVVAFIRPSGLNHMAIVARDANGTPVLNENQTSNGQYFVSTSRSLVNTAYKNYNKGAEVWYFLPQYKKVSGTALVPDAKIASKAVEHYKEGFSADDIIGQYVAAYGEGERKRVTNVINKAILNFRKKNPAFVQPSTARFMDEPTKGKILRSYIYSGLSAKDAWMERPKIPGEPDFMPGRLMYGDDYNAYSKAYNKAKKDVNNTVAQKIGLSKFSIDGFMKDPFSKEGKMFKDARTADKARGLIAQAFKKTGVYRHEVAPLINTSPYDWAVVTPGDKELSDAVRAFRVVMQKFVQLARAAGHVEWDETAMARAVMDFVTYHTGEEGWGLTNGFVRSKSNKVQKNVYQSTYKSDAAHRNRRREGSAFWNGAASVFMGVIDWLDPTDFVGISQFRSALNLPSLTQATQKWVESKGYEIDPDIKNWTTGLLLGGELILTAAPSGGASLVVRSGKATKVVKTYKTLRAAKTALATTAAAMIKYGARLPKAIANMDYKLYKAVDKSKILRGARDLERAAMVQESTTGFAGGITSIASKAYGTDWKPKEENSFVDKASNWLNKRAAGALSGLAQFYQAGAIADQDVNAIVAANEALARLPESPEFEAFGSAQTIGGAWDAFKKDPAGVIIDLLTQSATMFGPGQAATSVLTKSIGKYGQTIGTFLQSFGLEYSGTYVDSLRETAAKRGIDMSTVNGLKKMFSDPAAIGAAKLAGVQRGLPVAVFDAFSVMLGGHYWGKPGSNWLWKAAQTIGPVLGDAALGAGGEFLAQVINDENIAVGAILAEAGGEVVPGIYGGIVEARHGGAIDRAALSQNQKIVFDKILFAYNPYVGKQLGADINSATTDYQYNEERVGKFLEELRTNDGESINPTKAAQFMLDTQELVKRVLDGNVTPEDIDEAGDRLTVVKLMSNMTEDEVTGKIAASEENRVGFLFRQKIINGEQDVDKALDAAIDEYIKERTGVSISEETIPEPDIKLTPEELKEKYNSLKDDALFIDTAVMLGIPVSQLRDFYEGVYGVVPDTVDEETAKTIKKNLAQIASNPTLLSVAIDDADLANSLAYRMYNNEYKAVADYVFAIGNKAGVTRRDATMFANAYIRGKFFGQSSMRATLAPELAKTNVLESLGITPDSINEDNNVPILEEINNIILAIQERNEAKKNKNKGNVTEATGESVPAAEEAREPAEGELMSGTPAESSPTEGEPVEALEREPASLEGAATAGDTVGGPEEDPFEHAFDDTKEEGERQPFVLKNPPEMPMLAPWAENEREAKKEALDNTPLRLENDTRVLLTDGENWFAVDKSTEGLFTQYKGKGALRLPTNKDHLEFVDRNGDTVTYKDKTITDLMTPEGDVVPFVERYGGKRVNYEHVDAEDGARIYEINDPVRGTSTAYLPDKVASALATLGYDVKPAPGGAAITAEAVQIAGREAKNWPTVFGMHAPLTRAQLDYFKQPIDTGQKLSAPETAVEEPWQKIKAFTIDNSVPAETAATEESVSAREPYEEPAIIGEEMVPHLPTVGDNMTPEEMESELERERTEAATRRQEEREAERKAAREAATVSHDSGTNSSYFTVEDEAQQEEQHYKQREELAHKEEVRKKKLANLEKARAAQAEKRAAMLAGTDTEGLETARQEQKGAFVPDGEEMGRGEEVFYSPGADKPEQQAKRVLASYKNGATVFSVRTVGEGKNQKTVTVITKEDVDNALTSSEDAKKALADAEKEKLESLKQTYAKNKKLSPKERGELNKLRAQEVTPKAIKAVMESEKVGEIAAKDRLNRRVRESYLKARAEKLDKKVVDSLEKQAVLTDKERSDVLAKVREKLTKVVIDQGVTEVAEGAFEGCPNLKTVAFAPSVKKVGKNAFRNCPSMTTIRFLESMSTKTATKTISGVPADNAVINDDGTQTYVYDTMVEGLEEIGEGAFELSAAGTNSVFLYFPSSLKKIGKNAFHNNAITQDVLYIPGSCTEIGPGAFFSSKGRINRVVLPGYTRFQEKTQGKTKAGGTMMRSSFSTSEDTRPIIDKAVISTDENAGIGETAKRMAMYRKGVKVVNKRRTRWITAKSNVPENFRWERTPLQELYSKTQLRRISKWLPKPNHKAYQAIYKRAEATLININYRPAETNLKNYCIAVVAEQLKYINSQLTDNMTDTQIEELSRYIWDSSEIEDVYYGREEVTKKEKDKITDMHKGLSLQEYLDIMAVNLLGYYGNGNLLSRKCNDFIRYYGAKANLLGKPKAVLIKASLVYADLFARGDTVGAKNKKMLDALLDATARAEKPEDIPTLDVLSFNVGATLDTGMHYKSGASLEKQEKRGVYAVAAFENKNKTNRNQTRQELVWQIGQRLRNIYGSRLITKIADDFDDKLREYLGNKKNKRDFDSINEDVLIKAEMVYVDLCSREWTIDSAEKRKLLNKLLSQAATAKSDKNVSNVEELCISTKQKDGSQITFEQVINVPNTDIIRPGDNLAKWMTVGYADSKIEFEPQELNIKGQGAPSRRLMTRGQRAVVDSLANGGVALTNPQTKADFLDILQVFIEATAGKNDKPTAVMKRLADALDNCGAIIINNGAATVYSTSGRKMALDPGYTRIIKSMSAYYGRPGGSGTLSFVDAQDKLVHSFLSGAGPIDLAALRSSLTSSKRFLGRHLTGPLRIALQSDVDGFVFPVGDGYVLRANKQFIRIEGDVTQDIEIIKSMERLAATGSSIQRGIRFPVKQIGKIMEHFASAIDGLSEDNTRLLNTLFKPKDIVVKMRRKDGSWYNVDSKEYGITKLKNKRDKRLITELRDAGWVELSGSQQEAVAKALSLYDTYTRLKQDVDDASVEHEEAKAEVESLAQDNQDNVKDTLKDLLNEIGHTFDSRDDETMSQLNAAWKALVDHGATEDLLRFGRLLSQLVAKSTVGNAIGESTTLREAVERRAEELAAGDILTQEQVDRYHSDELKRDNYLEDVLEDFYKVCTDAQADKLLSSIKTDIDGKQYDEPYVDIQRVSVEDRNELFAHALDIQRIANAMGVVRGQTLKELGVQDSYVRERTHEIARAIRAARANERTNNVVAGEMEEKVSALLVKYNEADAALQKFEQEHAHCKGLFTRLAEDPYLALQTRKGFVTKQALQQFSVAAEIDIDSIPLVRLEQLDDMVSAGILSAAERNDFTEADIADLGFTSTIEDFNAIVHAYNTGLVVYDPTETVVKDESGNVVMTSAKLGGKSFHYGLMKTVDTTHYRLVQKMAAKGWSISPQVTQVEASDGGMFICERSTDEEGKLHKTWRLMEADRRVDPDTNYNGLLEYVSIMNSRYAANYRSPSFAARSQQMRDEIESITGVKSYRPNILGQPFGSSRLFREIYDSNIDALNEETTRAAILALAKRGYTDVSPEALGKDLIDATITFSDIIDRIVEYSKENDVTIQNIESVIEEMLTDDDFLNEVNQKAFDEAVRETSRINPKQRTVANSVSRYNDDIYVETDEQGDTTVSDIGGPRMSGSGMSSMFKIPAERRPLFFAIDRMAARNLARDIAKVIKDSAVSRAAARWETPALQISDITEATQKLNDTFGSLSSYTKNDKSRVSGRLLEGIISQLISTPDDVERAVQNAIDTEESLREREAALIKEAKGVGGEVSRGFAIKDIAEYADSIDLPAMYEQAKETIGKSNWVLSDNDIKRLLNIVASQLINTPGGIHEVVRDALAKVQFGTSSREAINQVDMDTVAALADYLSEINFGDIQDNLQVILSRNGVALTIDESKSLLGSMVSNLINNPSDTQGAVRAAMATVVQQDIGEFGTMALEWVNSDEHPRWDAAFKQAMIEIVAKIARTPESKTVDKQLLMTALYNLASQSGTDNDANSFIDMLERSKELEGVPKVVSIFKQVLLDIPAEEAAAENRRAKKEDKAREQRAQRKAEGKRFTQRERDLFAELGVDAKLIDKAEVAFAASGRSFINNNTVKAKMAELVADNLGGLKDKKGTLWNIAFAELMGINHNDYKSQRFLSRFVPDMVPFDIKSYANASAAQAEYIHVGPDEEMANNKRLKLRLIDYIDYSLAQKIASLCGLYTKRTSKEDVGMFDPVYGAAYINKRFYANPVVYAHEGGHRMIAKNNLFGLRDVANALASGDTEALSKALDEWQASLGDMPGIAIVFNNFSADGHANNFNQLASVAPGELNEDQAYAYNLLEGAAEFYRNYLMAADTVRNLSAEAEYLAGQIESFYSNGGMDKDLLQVRREFQELMSDYGLAKARRREVASRWQARRGSFDSFVSNLGFNLTHLGDFMADTTETFVDANMPIRMFTEYVTGLKNEQFVSKNNPYDLARLVAGWPDKAHEQISRLYEILNATGTREVNTSTSKLTFKVGERQYVLPAATRLEYKDFDMYIRYKHILNLLEATDVLRENPPTRKVVRTDDWGNQVEMDEPLPVSPLYQFDMSKDEVQKVVEELEALHPDMKSVYENQFIPWWRNYVREYEKEFMTPGLYEQATRDYTDPTQWQEWEEGQTYTRKVWSRDKEGNWSSKEEEFVATKQHVAEHEAERLVNQGYVPLIPDDDPTLGMRAFAFYDKDGNPINTNVQGMVNLHVSEEERADASGIPTKPVIDIITRRVSRNVRSSMGNKAALAAVGFLDDPNEVRQSRANEYFTRLSREHSDADTEEWKSENTYHVYKDGEQIFYKASVKGEKLFRTLTGLSTEEDAKVGTTRKLWSTFSLAGLIRFFVTRFPAFWIRNAWKDSMYLGAVSRGNFIPFWGFWAGVISYFRQDDDFKEYVKYGASTSTRLNDDWNTIPFRDALRIALTFDEQKKQERLNKVERVKCSDGGKTWVAKLMDASEMGNRVGNYKATVKALQRENERENRGWTEEDIKTKAAMETRDVLDWGMHGTNPAFNCLLSTIAFSRSNLNSLAYLTRVVQSPTPGRFLKMVLVNMVYALYPTLIEYMLYARDRDDDDDEDRMLRIEYKNMSERTKYSCHLVHIPGTHTWLTFPSTFACGELFHSMLKRSMLAMAERDPRHFDGWLWDVWDTVTGGGWNGITPPLPNFFQTILEVKQNRSVWNNKPIVPYFAQKKEKPFQYNDRTSEILKLIAARTGGGYTTRGGVYHKKAGWSPMEMEYYFNAFFPNGGKSILNMADALAKSCEGNPDGATASAKEAFANLARGLYVRDNMYSTRYSFFNTMIEDVDSVYFSGKSFESDDATAQKYGFKSFDDIKAAYKILHKAEDKIEGKGKGADSLISRFYESIELGDDNERVMVKDEIARIADEAVQEVLDKHMILKKERE